MVLRAIKRFGLLLLIVFFGFGLVGCLPEANHNDNPKIEEEDDAKEREKINYIYNLLEENYYSNLNLNLEEIDSLDELFTYTDPYTKIYEQGSTNIEKDNTYVGLGITITDHDDGLYVSGVNEYLDINKEIYVGDLIIEVNETSLKDLDFIGKKKLLSGELNESLNIVISRLNKDIEKTVTFVEVPFYSVYYDVIEEIGYLKINRFARDTDELFIEYLNILEQNNIQGLIIDVRDNGGGYLTSVLNILKIFLDGEDPLFYMYSTKEDKLTPYMPSENNERKTYPITVLVNSNSASASEILASVMQKHGYKLFGEKTYGKDVYQYGLSLSEEFFPPNHILNVTNGYWLLDLDKTVYGGIIPDVPFYEKGLRNLVYPILNQEYSKGNSSPYIGVYQYLINQVVKGDYIPNHFDEGFAKMVKDYQELKDLPITGVLDEATLKYLISFYIELKINYLYDELLIGAVEDMEKTINES